MATNRLVVALVLIAALGTGGFFIGRQLMSGGSQAQAPGLSNQLRAVQTQEAQKQAEPRFSGQLLGIYLAPSLDQLPPDVQSEHERLSVGGCVPVSVEQASALDLPRPLAMPPSYVLAQQDSANVGTNPWALACGGSVSSRGWDYTTTGAQGIPATVSIVRIVTKYDTQDVAKSQVSTQIIGGREAIIVRPASSGGLAQRYLIYFPESFGHTSIQTFNLPEADALKVAEAAAEASR